VITDLLTWAALVSGAAPSSSGAALPPPGARIPTLPEVRVEAARRPRGAASVPMAATVLDRAAIEASGAQGVGDLLRPVVGVRVATTGGPGSFSPISIRGSTNDQVLVLVDGRRLNAAQGGGVDLSDVPLENVERIEVLRGGASALYGADAIGGVVNIVTRALPDDAEEGTLRTELGSLGSRRVSGHVANTEGAMAWRLDGRWAVADGEFDAARGGVSGGDRGRVTNGDLDSRFLDGRAEWSFGPGAGLSVSAGHYGAEKGIPGSREFPSDSAVQDDELSSASLIATASPRLEARAFVQRRLRAFDDPGFALGAVADRHRNEAWGGQVESRRDFGRAGRTTAGLEWRRDELRSTTDGTRRRGTTALLLRHAVAFGGPGDASPGGASPGPTAVAGAGPLEAADVPGARFELTPALRLDAIEGFDARLSPRLMAEWRPGRASGRAGRRTAWSLRASIGRSFRPPTFDDLFLAPRASAAGNPDLRPESATDADVGATLRRGSAHVTVTAFWNRIEDLIQWHPGAAGVWRPHNVDGARILGLEVEASLALPAPGPGERCRLHANATLLDPRETGDAPNTGGKVLVYRPRGRANAQLTYGAARWDLETQWRWTGSVFTTRANTQSLPGSLVGDLALRWRASRALELESRLLNVSDADFQDLRDYPAPGRQWRLAAVLRRVP
jgi:vitamin B12 transporter